MKAASKKYCKKNAASWQPSTGFVRSMEVKKIRSAAMSIRQRWINTALAGVRKVYKVKSKGKSYQVTLNDEQQQSDWKVEVALNSPIS